MSAKYKSPSFLLPNELNTNTNPLNTDGNSATGTGINSLYSMDFNGSEYINCGNPTELQFTDSFSISGWFKSSSSSASAIVSKDANLSGRCYLVQLNSLSVGALRFRIFVSNASVTIDHGTGLNDNNWHHFVCVYEKGVGISLYIDNGTPGFTATTGTIDNDAVDFNIGRRSDGLNYFNGQIDEVAIFNRVLNTTEIAALYDGTGSNIRPSNLMATNLNPIAYYPLGEQAQNSGYLSATGNEWQFPNGVLQDYVMDFDGSSDYINVGENVLPSGDFTISAWVKPDSFPIPYATIFSSYENSASGRLLFRIKNDGKLELSLDSVTLASNTSLSANTWQHVMVTLNGTSLTFYLNGSSDGSGTASTPPAQNLTTYIGAWDNGGSPNGFFNGEISNLAIWNTDQSANIANIYNNGSPQTTYTVTPQNWWKLNADSVYTPSVPNYTTSLNFSGSGNRVNFNPINLSGNKTVSYWLKPLGRGLIVAGQNYRYYSYYNNSTIVMRDSSGTSSWPSLSLDNTKWYHFCITGDGTNATLYVNGESKGSQPDRSPTVDTIGAYTSGFDGFFNGNVSNLAIYNVILTSSQVSTLFNFGTPETTPSFSPQAWWKLDDQNTITDSSGNGNTGTNNGAVNSPGGVAVVPSWKIPSALPITTTPNYTTALDFVASQSDYIDTNSTFSSLTSFSISAWFKADVTNAFVKSIVSTRINNPPSAPGTTGSQGLDIYINSNNLVGRVYNNGETEVTTSFTDTTSWHHVVLTYNATTLEFYLDGSSLGTSTGSYTNSGVNLLIGQWTKTSGYNFDGEISNVSIFNSGLTPLQVSTLYNGGTPETAISFSPVSWWKLDTGGSTITDYGSGGNNGTNNGATQVTSDVLTTQPVNGVSTTLPSTALQQSNLQFDSPYSNYSLSFDGTGDYITIPDSTTLEPQNLTVSFWINAGTQSNYEYYLEKGNFSYAVYTGATTTGLIFFIYDGSNYYLSNALTNVLDSNWHHIAFTYDGSQIIGYKDGVANTPVSASATILYDTNPLRLFSRGTAFPSAYPSGKMDELAIWNTALLPAQVLEIYNNGKPNDLNNFSGAAPISWWRLGENAYFDNNSFIVPNSISGAPNGTGAGTVTSMLSADAPGTYANGIGDGLAITDRVGDAPLSVANSQSYNMIPDDKIPYVPGYVGDQIANNFSMTFDGVDDKIDISFDFNITTAVSVSAWVKTNTNGNQYDIIVLAYNGGSSRYGIEVGSSGKAAFVVRTTSAPRLESTTAISDNTWRHIVGTWDGVNTKIYINGILENTGSLTGTILSAPDLSIGGLPNYYYEGKIDEVGIWNTALTSDQIKFDLYRPTSEGTNQTADLVNNPNLPTPVAWYRMGD